MESLSYSSDSTLEGEHLRSWVQYETEDGEVYYYNEVTNMSQWEIPEELARGLVVGDGHGVPTTGPIASEDHGDGSSASGSVGGGGEGTFSGDELPNPELLVEGVGEMALTAPVLDEEDSQGVDGYQPAEGEQSQWNDLVEHERGIGSLPDPAVPGFAPEDAKEPAAPNAETEPKDRTLEIWNQFFENAMLSRRAPDDGLRDLPYSDEDLFRAVASHDAQKVEEVLLSGVDASAEDRHQRTPLHYAAYHDDKAVVAVLTEFNASIEAMDYNGNSSLHVSAARGSYSVLVFLLESAATVNAANRDGDTPLHLALWFAHADCVDKLLEYSADLGARNKQGLDPHQNVLERSPLVQQSPLPVDLQLALDAISRHEQRMSSETVALSEEAAAHETYQVEPALPFTAPHHSSSKPSAKAKEVGQVHHDPTYGGASPSLAASTPAAWSEDEFHDCEEEEEVYAEA